MDKNAFSRDFWMLLCIFLIIISVICFLPWILVRWDLSCFNDTGEVGDTIGGIMSPFVAIAAAFLTFLAFWVQFKANEQQRKDISKERFENKFYELIHLHRENVKALRHHGNEGREAIVSSCYYISSIYSLIDNSFLKFYKNDTNALAQLQDLSKAYPDVRFLFMEIAYNLFIYGEDYLRSLSCEEKEFAVYQHVIHMIKTMCPFNTCDNRYMYIPSDRISLLTKEYFECKDRDGAMVMYIPDDFLANNHDVFGIYFRQLYHIVKMIAKSDLLSEKERYDYIKILRSQLSDFEQILLYYNSMSRVGYKWNRPMPPSHVDLNEAWRETMKLIPRFRLIRNIPPSFQLFGVLPEEYYKDEIAEYKKRNISFFEWN